MTGRDEPLRPSELVGTTPEAFWKLIAFVAEREPQRAEHYHELERIDRRRRAIRKELLRRDIRRQAKLLPNDSLTLTDALRALEGVRRRDNGKWVALCPVHEDKIASLVIFEHSDTPDVPVFFCSAGCTWQDIRTAIQIRS